MQKGFIKQVNSGWKKPVWKNVSREDKYKLWKKTIL
jgi:hypothetical protein